MEKMLEFKNNELAVMINFLGNLQLKNKYSLARTKLIKLLNAKYEEFISDIKELREPYFEKDENGNLKVNDDQKYIYTDKVTDKDKHSLTEALDELDNEQITIDFTEYSKKLKDLYEALVSYDIPFSGQDAVAYENLVDQLDNNYRNEE